MIKMATNDENWDDDPPYPTFTYGDRGYGACSTSFGREKKKSASKLCAKAGIRLRLQDQDARQEIIARNSFQVTCRPTVSLQLLEENLAGLHRFKIGKPTKTDNQEQFSTHFLDIKDNKTLTSSVTALKEVIDNIQHYRVMSLDTEGKEHPLFLIVGDFCGNVIMMNNALNCPPELRSMIEDVRIYKVQSNIAEDWEMLKKVGIMMKGTADSQVIFGAFIQPLGKKGSAAQSVAIGADSRPFKHHCMAFGKDNQRPSKSEWLHAVMDARQPLLTLFKATVMRAKSYDSTMCPVKPDDDVFGILWDCLNRVAGVPIKDFQTGIPPYKLLPTDNWTTGKEEKSDEGDLNCCSEVFKIKSSQKDWPAPKTRRSQLFRKLFQTKEQRIAQNLKRSCAKKMRLRKRRNQFLSGK